MSFSFESNIESVSHTEHGTQTTSSDYRSAKRISRDEMNLAEFPLAVLSTRVNPNLKTLEFNDTVLGKNGNVLKRNWVITGADKFGLPTASDDEVLLGLLKLTVDDGLESQKVFFTRYELLKILRWSTEGRSYLRLQNAFDRLTGVRVKATNAFYDNETKTHSTKNFGIVDAYEINDGRDADTKPSYFIWSEELFKSFQVGFIKKLDLDFYLGLNSAVSKRLYRYLDKHFWYKVQVSINLFTLGHEKLGISRNYKYASSLRQQLDPAVQELSEKGFLSGCEYHGRGKGTEVTFYAGRKKPRSVDEKEKTPTVRHTSSATSSESQESGLVDELAVALEKRGINSTVSLRLLSGKDTDGLQRIKKIINHFDQLLAESSPRISRNPVGFLYKAVERPFQYSLPDEVATPKKDAVSREAKHNGHKEQERKQEAREVLFKEYLDIRAREVARLLDTVEEKVLLNIRDEAEKSLVRLKKVLSEGRYREALDHTVEERLAALFALPTFEEWFAEQR